MDLSKVDTIVTFSMLKLRENKDELTLENIHLKIKELNKNGLTKDIISQSLVRLIRKGHIKEEDNIFFLVSGIVFYYVEILSPEDDIKEILDLLERRLHYIESLDNYKNRRYDL